MHLQILYLFANTFALFVDSVADEEGMPAKKKPTAAEKGKGKMESAVKK